MNKKPVWIAIAFVIVFLGVIVYSTLNLSKEKVEVCMAYNGRTSCRVASATTREFALRTAITNVCGEIASGVTDTIGCNQATPTSVKWLK
jgi:energy-converting hydrogenase Eha subunit H